MAFKKEPINSTFSSPLWVPLSEASPIPDLSSVAALVQGMIAENVKIQSSFIQIFEKSILSKGQLFLQKPTLLDSEQEKLFDEIIHVSCCGSQIQLKALRSLVEALDQSLESHLLPTYRSFCSVYADTIQSFKEDPHFLFEGFYDLIGNFLTCSVFSDSPATYQQQKTTTLDNLDENIKKYRFYIRQILAALSPNNFLWTNEALLKDTFRERGQNLLRGLDMFLEDLEAGKGILKIRQTPPDSFVVGETIAVTKGKVIYRNALMELIHYTPVCSPVASIPLLIIPPWINKYYVLDLTPERSFVRWLLEQGFNVFLISWVNPDSSHRFCTFSDYMQKGILTSIDIIAKICGQEKGSEAVGCVGYCIGGTLLSLALALLAQREVQPIKHATFLAAQVDFEEAGELKFFTDESHLQFIEALMKEEGYLSGPMMGLLFNLLRADTLIWPYVVNNYFRGKDPLPFDILSWNGDCTHLSAAAHIFYLRNFYLRNALAKGEMVIEGTLLDLKKIILPTYHVAAKEDHIAPASSIFRGVHFFGGEPTFLLAESGHIAGIVNAPAKNKYGYWTSPHLDHNIPAWLSHATYHSGSWWTHWKEWLDQQDSEKTVPIARGGKYFPPLCDAPGKYVTVKV